MRRLCRRALSSSAATTPGVQATATAAAAGNVTVAPSERPSKRITIHTLRQLKQARTPITMLTAYDFPSAVHVDVANIDVLLVGDSVGMVELGLDTTLPVTMDDMIHHCKAVSRGCRRPLLVGDMPFGVYEVDPRQAFASAARILKEGGMDCVKMEGGKARSSVIRAVVDGGVAVMGHIGLTPQAFSALGGFRAQGRTATQALGVLQDALAVQEAGAFALVIECVPALVAEDITRRLEIPTIGIGSGGGTDGQVLVYHDLLGMMMHPWHGQHALKFCKQYAAVGTHINLALAQYRDEVKSRAFPGTAFAPYVIPDDEASRFMDELAKFDAQHTAVGAASITTVAADHGERLYGAGASKQPR